MKTRIPADWTGMMYMKDEKNRRKSTIIVWNWKTGFRNLLWTISGDYTLNMKVDVFPVSALKSNRSV